jgi:hypothetical protein
MKQQTISSKDKREFNRIHRIKLREQAQAAAARVVWPQRKGGQR